MKDRAIYSHNSVSRGFVPHHLVSERQVAHDTILINMSEAIKEESNGNAGDLDEIPLPEYAEDLAVNVREGFDHTCEFVLRCHNNLKTKMDKRFDDLGAHIGVLQTIVENLQVQAPQAPPPVAQPPRDGRADDRHLPAQPLPQVEDHVGDAGFAAGYAPRQRHHDPRAEAIAHGGVNNRDRFRSR